MQILDHAHRYMYSNIVCNMESKPLLQDVQPVVSYLIARVLLV